MFFLEHPLAQLPPLHLSAHSPSPALCLLPVFPLGPILLPTSSSEQASRPHAPLGNCHHVGHPSSLKDFCPWEKKKRKKRLSRGVATQGMQQLCFICCLAFCLAFPCALGSLLGMQHDKGDNAGSLQACCCLRQQFIGGGHLSSRLWKSSWRALQ